MNRRPHGKKPPFVALRVVKASHELNAGLKDVLEEDWAVDNDGPQGCYMAAGEIALRRGMAQATVESYRSELAALGLEVVGGFAVAAQGYRLQTRCRYVVLPPEVIPRSTRVTMEQLLHCRDQLDAYIRMQRGLTRVQPQLVGREPQMVQVQPQLGGVNSESAPLSRAAGGKGGVPTSASQGEATVHPALTEKEDGRRLREPEAEDGEEREPTAAERREMADRERADRAMVEQNAATALTAKLAERRRSLGIIP